MTRLRIVIVGDADPDRLRAATHEMAPLFAVLANVLGAASLSLAVDEVPAPEPVPLPEKPS